jgi:hypothetical protein
VPINIRQRAGDAVRGSWVGDRNPKPAGQTSVSQAYYNEPRSAYDTFPSGGAATFSWVQEQTTLKRSRQADLDLYEAMDEGFPEISAALDAYADNATQVGVTRADAARGADQIVQVVTPNEELKQFLSEIFDRLRVDRRAWTLARSMVKNGEEFEEVVVDRTLRVDRVKSLPASHIIRNEDRFGVLDPKKAFVQLDQTFEQEIASFEDWEVVHFRLLTRNDDRYGRSILHPVRRVFKQLQMVEDSMVVARLTRAWSKLVFVVDTGTMPPPLAHEHVERIKQEHKKRRLVDPRTGQLRTDYNPISSEEDIFLGLSKGGQSRVDQLYGDLNIGNLSDVEYFQNKLFGGLKVPKAYLGIERDVNSRATVTNQDIQFARTVRRIQLAMRAGYHQMAELALVLEAPASLRKEIDESRFSVVLPAMQTVDEFREWEIVRVQSQVAQVLSTQLMIDPVFVLCYIFGFSEDQAKKIFQGLDSPFAKLGQNQNALKSIAAGTDKKIGASSTEMLDRPDVQKALHDLLDAVATEDRDGWQVLEDLKWMMDVWSEQRRHSR